MATKIVQIALSEDEHDRIKEQADKKNIPVSTYIKNYILGNRKFEEYLELLLSNAAKTRPGEYFNVRSLMGAKWAEINQRGIKMALGKAFYNYVKSEKEKGLEGIVIIKKDSANTQWYERR